MESTTFTILNLMDVEYPDETRSLVYSFIADEIGLKKFIKAILDNS